MCFLLPPQEYGPKKQINNLLTPSQSRDNPAKMFMFSVFFAFSSRIDHYSEKSGCP